MFCMNSVQNVANLHLFRIKDMQIGDFSVNADQAFLMPGSIVQSVAQQIQGSQV